MFEFLIALIFRFLKVVHIQLSVYDIRIPQETREVLVFEVFWKNPFRKYVLIMDYECCSFIIP